MGTVAHSRHSYMLFLARSSLFLIRKIKTIQIQSSSSLMYISIWLLSAILISFHLQKLYFLKEFCLRLVLFKLPLSLCFPSDCGKELSLGNNDGSGYVPRGEGVKVDKGWWTLGVILAFCEQSTCPCTEVAPHTETVGMPYVGSMSNHSQCFPFT